MESIGKLAFYECTGLNEIVWAKGIKTIGGQAFYTLFPKVYPVDKDGADFDGNGKVTDADALILLWYMLFPEN